MTVFMIAFFMKSVFMVVFFMMMVFTRPFFMMTVFTMAFFKMAFLRHTKVTLLFIFFYQMMTECEKFVSFANPEFEDESVHSFEETIPKVS